MTVRKNGGAKGSRERASSHGPEPQANDPAGSAVAVTGALSFEELSTLPITGRCKHLSEWTYCRKVSGKHRSCQRLVVTAYSWLKQGLWLQCFWRLLTNTDKLLDGRFSGLHSSPSFVRKHTQGQLLLGVWFGLPSRTENHWEPQLSTGPGLTLPLNQRLRVSTQRGTK